MDENYLKQELYELLKSKEEIFDFIQSCVLDGFWYWDLEKPENEWINPKFWEILGYNSAEKKHLSSEWQNIIFADDLKLAKENLDKHLADPNHPYDQVVRYKHKNGNTIWVRCRGIAIRDNDNKPIRMIGAHVDITPLKEYEIKLKKLAYKDSLTGPGQDHLNYG